MYKGDVMLLEMLEIVAKLEEVQLDKSGLGKKCMQ